MTETTVMTQVQEEILDAVRASQAAVVDVLQVWTSALKSVTPELPGVTVPFAGKLPKPEELISGTYDFAGQLLASQRKFAEEIAAMTTPVLTGHASAPAAKNGAAAR